MIGHVTQPTNETTNPEEENGHLNRLESTTLLPVGAVEHAAVVIEWSSQGPRLGESILVGFQVFGSENSSVLHSLRGGMEGGKRRYTECMGGCVRLCVYVYILTAFLPRNKALSCR